MQPMWKAQAFKSLADMTTENQLEKRLSRMTSTQVWMALGEATMSNDPNTNQLVDEWDVVFGVFSGKTAVPQGCNSYKPRWDQGKYHYNSKKL